MGTYCVVFEGDNNLSDDWLMQKLLNEYLIMFFRASHDEFKKILSGSNHHSLKSESNIGRLFTPKSILKAILLQDWQSHDSHNSNVDFGENNSCFQGMQDIETGH